MQERVAHASSQDFGKGITYVRRGAVRFPPRVVTAPPASLHGADLIEGLAEGSIVYLVETMGEVEALWAGKVPAMCPPLHHKGGAWEEAYTRQLEPFSVCIIPSAGWPASSPTSARAKLLTLQGRCKAVKLCPPPPCGLEGPADIQTFLLTHSVGDLVKWALEVPGVEVPHKNGKTPKRPLADGFSMAELAKMDIPPPQWLLEGLLPEGCMILAGRPKIGKSWLALGLALAVASDHGRFLGQQVVGPGTVLYFALEDTRGRLKRRLQQIEPDQSAWPARFVFVEEPRSGPEGIKEIDLWCEQRVKAGETIRMIVVDTLARMRKSPRAGASVYHEDLEAIAPLHWLARKWHCVVMLVDHQRKAAADDIFDSVTGSLAKTGTVDGTWILERLRNQSFAKLSITGRDIEESERMLSFDASRGLWGPITDQAAASGLPPLQRRILKAMEPRGVPKSAGDIAAIVGLSIDRLRTQLHQLQVAGYVSKFSARTWVYEDPEVEQLPLPPTTTTDVTDVTDVTGITDVTDRATTATGAISDISDIELSVTSVIETAETPKKRSPGSQTEVADTMEICPDCGGLWPGIDEARCDQCGFAGAPVLAPAQ